MDTLDHAEPLICIDRSAQPQTIIPGKSHQLQELEREHMRPVRLARQKEQERKRERQREGKKKKRYPFVSVGWVQWRILYEKSDLSLAIAPGIFVLGDVTKCDIIAHSGSPVHCSLVITRKDHWHGVNKGYVWFTINSATRIARFPVGPNFCTVAFWDSKGINYVTKRLIMCPHLVRIGHILVYFALTLSFLNICLTSCSFSKFVSSVVQNIQS